ncbi:hypothetical protein [Polyangium mundeleinium]|uniref:Nucleotidyltransferase n=1 Tax=Polyangium mundeleinium TaxID=2995306 RepID=A0ABT5ESL2_9BACT|nr:hypothetical protein [Polyangium mundeleinium]MDC0744808.1 hypothetical protein [Polyangium mundeleinium]
MPPKLPHTATRPPRKAPHPATVAQAKAPHAAKQPVLKAPHPATVVQRRTPHAGQVLQRMDWQAPDDPGPPPNDQTVQLPPKDPWRHLTNATSSNEWPHRGNELPLVQILVAQQIVKLLRSAQIEARLGGSVAALGYSTTRVPDDIDIDILPKGKHLDEGKKELDRATVLICTRLTRGYRLGAVRDSWYSYVIDQFTLDKSTAYVVSLVIDGKVVCNRHNERSYEVEIHETPLQLKLQLINETAFTFMIKTIDPGEVSVEKYKEVAGFSRLVANCIGRYLQDPRGPKNDRERARQMLRAKLLSAQRTKVIAVCARILLYFGLKDDDGVKSKNDRLNAAQLLDEIVTELRIGFSQGELLHELQQRVPTQEQPPVDVSLLLQQLSQFGILNFFNITKQ